MATTLQQQLAAIAANSTNQLDLKAQKGRHGKSLLFEPRDAVSQSFETIYQLCYEGFEELCMLDARFNLYARNLFSEQSKNEDRTQMTAKENAELDQTVESFLGLLGGRLLLKPAMKAMEWLVRRFRVQEYNTETTLLTFLPYHTSHIFPTLLSIMPEQLPATMKWLHPYVAALQSPPRHAVLSAAITNTGFFSAFSQYVLRISQAKRHSALLLGFWASITAQAVNGMIDSTRSGRDAIRKQREEDLLLRVLPTLQSALSIKGVPELYLGACMIITILATKASLEDNVLDAMMEAVAGAWSPQNIEDGLTCLAIISEEKQRVSQPKSVTRSILKAEEPTRLLENVSKRYRVDKLVLGIAVGLLDPAASNSVTKGLEFVTRVIDLQLLSRQHLLYLVGVLLEKAAKLHSSDALSPDSEALITFLSDFSNDAEAASVLQEAARQQNVDLRSIPPSLVMSSGPAEIAADPTDDDSFGRMEIDDQSLGHTDGTGADFDAVPKLDNKRPSFLDPFNNEAFEEYTAAFATASISQKDIQRFINLESLQRSKVAERPTYLTFLARAALSGLQTPVRVRALQLAAKSQMEGLTPLDMQALLPYAIAALSDEAQKVRTAAATLCKSIHDWYDGGNKGKVGKDVRNWCGETVYEANGPKIHPLSAPDAFKFVSSVVIPMLDDCVLDGGYCVRALADVFNGSLGSGVRPAGKESKELKASLRADLCTFLASHAAATPALFAKIRLLDLLHKAGKVANDARKTVLLPYVKQWVATQPTDTAHSMGVALPKDLARAVIGSLSHRSAEEIQTLKLIASGELGAGKDLSMFAFERLRHLWSAMKAPSQMALADFLLDLAISGSDTVSNDKIQGEALESIRNLRLPGEALVHLVEGLPHASDLQDQPPSTKKRRTSKADTLQPRDVDSAKLNAAVRRITLVLEVVEGSKPEQHPRLLKGLFSLLGELHTYKLLLGSQLVYLQGLLMGCLLSVVDALKDGKAEDVDRSAIRADLVVECVRTTSSTQVHNTALLLISSLATWAPELVLHSVMPLFTFMSTTLLRQSDEYSAHVTDQTVARIVPPLAASLKKKGKDLVSGASELLLSFTAAFEHIPLHRRAGLFRHLVQTLGSGESLFAVVAMLVERYPTDIRVEPFVSELMSTFSPSVQLQAFSQYLGLVFDALKPKRALSNVVLGLGEKDEEQIRESVETLLQAVASLLRKDSLRKRVAKGFARAGTEAETLQSTYAQLLDQTMQLTRDLASNGALKDTADTVLASLLGLTPTKDFIGSSAQLMQTGSDETRQQVFHSLEARVTQAKRGDVELQQTFLEVMPNCCVFIDPSQPIATRHAAITCIDQIADKYGRRDRAAVFETARVVAGEAALGSADTSLRVISTLCLASMVGVLQDEIIPILPQVLNTTLGYAEEAVKTSKFDYTVLNATSAFAIAVLDHLPWIFSAQYLDRTFWIAARWSTQSDTTSLKQLYAFAAKKISAAELFASIDRTWAEVTALGPDAARAHLEVLHAAVLHHSKATVSKDAQSLFTVLLKAFDLRRTEADDDEYSTAFALVNGIALDTTLKLNDATFRPFFIRLVEWATAALPKRDVRGRVLRATSLYHFTHLLFEQLKSIVTSYASFLLENAVDVLNTTVAKTEEERELLDSLLRTLASSFRNDQDDFWQAPAHLDAIATPLLRQLEKAEYLPVTKDIVPAITELATAAASPEHHKALNTVIMQYMRHQDAAVRLAAVKCERAITERLNFDWLALLPEMLPFISELQEDDDEGVEEETLRWVRQIEEVTGESLEGMLQ